MRKSSCLQSDLLFFDYDESQMDIIVSREEFDKLQADSLAFKSLLRVVTEREKAIQFHGSEQHARSLLHYAANYGEVASVKLLLDAKALVDGEIGNTPLWFALHGAWPTWHNQIGSEKCKQCALLLIEAGADLELTGKSIEIPQWARNHAALVGRCAMNNIVKIV